MGHDFAILTTLDAQTTGRPRSSCEMIMLRKSGNSCGRTKRVNWVYFLETWLKILNNLTRLKVGYNKITGLYLMRGRTEMGHEVG